MIRLKVDENLPESAAQLFRGRRTCRVRRRSSSSLPSAVGTLFFLSAGGMPTLYDIDPTNAAVLAMSTIMAPGGGTPSLAFWGGSFYLFASNRVTEYDPKAKSLEIAGHGPDPGHRRRSVDLRTHLALSRRSASRYLPERRLKGCADPLESL